MSWGERSCIHFGNCDIATMYICQCSCNEYISNGKKPDSNAESILKEMKVKNADGKEMTKAPKDMLVVPSTLPNFSKSKEFVVLKGRIFNIQHVSPKKIILKYKGMVKKEQPIPNGIFCLKEQDAPKVEVADVKSL